MKNLKKFEAVHGHKATLKGVCSPRREVCISATGSEPTVRGRGAIPCQLSGSIHQRNSDSIWWRMVSSDAWFILNIKTKIVPYSWRTDPKECHSQSFVCHSNLIIRQAFYGPRHSLSLRSHFLTHLNLLIQYERIRTIIHNQYREKLCLLPTLHILAPLMMAPRPFVPIFSWSIYRRRLAIHLVDGCARDGDSDCDCTVMPMGGGAAIGRHGYEGDEDGFARKVGGMVLLEDLEVFAWFAGGCFSILRRSVECLRLKSDKI